MKLDCLHIVWRGPFCLPSLVVHCAYPIWWSIVFTPFGGALCLPRLVVQFVYPVWWSILFTPFGGPLCLPHLVVHCVYLVWWNIILNQLARRSPGAASRTRLRLNSGWNADAFKRVCDLKAVAKHICDPTAVGTQTLKRTVRRKLCDGNCATETLFLCLVSSFIELRRKLRRKLSLRRKLRRKLCVLAYL